MPLKSDYAGPRVRPTSLDQYYSRGTSFSDYKETVTAERKRYTLKRIVITTEAGPVTIDYFKRRESDENLVFVFPILGGKNTICDYFADYIAGRGFDSAVVHRVDDFKDPKNFDRIESLLRDGVVRDRIAMDFFTQVYGKKNFGSFGISRGAINVAMTAGVDERLKYNVMVMGGSDIPTLLRRSDQPRLDRYMKQVEVDKNLNGPQVFALLEKSVKTDPKYLASYLDAKNTLMILALFDKTVPIQSGLNLREQIGHPETIFLFADHRTTALYSGLANLASGPDGGEIWPFQYIEKESLDFYNRSFKTGKRTNRAWPYRILSTPFDLLGKALSAAF